MFLLMLLLILLMPVKFFVIKKFKEELKLANLEKEELVVRLDESNKKNEFLRNQISS